MLIELSKQCRLIQGRWSKIEPPADYGEKKLLKYALELCDYVGSDEEKCIIREGKPLEEGVIIHTVHSLETKAFTKMWEFEGRDPVTANRANDKAGSIKKKPTYIALGRSVYKYKKWLADQSGVPARIGDAKNEVLTERPYIVYLLLN